ERFSWTTTMTCWIFCPCELCARCTNERPAASNERSGPGGTTDVACPAQALSAGPRTPSSASPATLRTFIARSLLVHRGKVERRIDEVARRAFGPQRHVAARALRKVEAVR